MTERPLPPFWAKISDTRYERTDGIFVEPNEQYWQGHDGNGRHTVLVTTPDDAMGLSDAGWPRRDIRPANAPRPVGAETSNALITEAPLTNGELDMLRLHFAELAELCVVSGPRFSNARRDAVDMHNRAVRRMRGIRDEVRRRATMEDEDALLDIV